MKGEHGVVPEHDLVIGKALDGRDFLCFGGGEHSVLHARSGAGKSVGFSIPNAFAWPGSLVCLDIKRELFQHTAGYRASRGHNVILFDPAAPDGRSHRWNPFWQVDRQSPDRFDQISRISYQIWPEALGQNTGNTDFWNAAAREAFCAIANFVAETEGLPLTMAEILRVFMRGDADLWLRSEIKAARNTSQPYTRAVVDGINGYLSADARLGGSIAKAVTTRLQIWSNPRVAAATSATDFDLRDIRREPMAIYVGVSPGDIPRNAPLLRLFFDALLNVNTSTTPEQDPSLKVPTLILLDEFAQLGRMDRLAHACSMSGATAFASLWWSRTARRSWTYTAHMQQRTCSTMSASRWCMARATKNWPSSSRSVSAIPRLPWKPRTGHAGLPGPSRRGSTWPNTRIAGH